MSGHVLQFACIYALLGALAGLALYLWERAHRRRLDVMLPVYVLLGALFGGLALFLLGAAVPGILLLKAQAAWSRRVRKNTPVEFPWLDMNRADQRDSVKTPRTR